MLSWFQQIDAAKDSSQVVAIIRDYLASWTPEELSRLPIQCRPGRVKGEQDIEELHGALVEEYGRNRLEGEALSALQRVTAVIVRASVRIAQLRSEEDNSGEPEPPSRPAGRGSSATRDT